MVPAWWCNLAATCVGIFFMTYGALSVFVVSAVTPIPYATELFLVVFGWGLVYRSAYVYEKRGHFQEDR